MCSVRVPSLLETSFWLLLLLGLNFPVLTAWWHHPDSMVIQHLEFFRSFSVFLRNQSHDDDKDDDKKKSGPWNSQLPFLLPTGHMVMSCMMMVKHFVGFLLGFSHDRVLTDLARCQHHNFPLLPRIKKPPDPSTGAERRANKRRKRNRNNSFRGITRLVLLAALSKAAVIPEIALGSDLRLRKQLRPFRQGNGCLNTCQLSGNEHLLGRLNACLEHAANTNALIDQNQMFTIIVDTGCSITTTPCKEDFVEMWDLDTPVTLQGVAGDKQVTQGGIVRHELLTTEGNVAVIHTLAHHNPDMNFRLFSPQAFFKENKSQNHCLKVTHDKACLEIHDTGTVEFQIDHSTFMPLMPAFHSATKAADALLNANSLEADNMTAVQQLLHQWHCKLGHLGFKRVQWLGRCGFLGKFGHKFGKSTIIPPKCEACITGGQERTSIQGTTVTQTRKGILKADKLKPGDLVFSDQRVSSLEGQNFNARGQTLRHMKFKGGTVFCDSASGCMFLVHQVGFTDQETVQSKLKFE